MEKAVLIIGRFFIILFMLRVGITAVKDGSAFLFAISVGLFILFFKLPKLIKYIS